MEFKIQDIVEHKLSKEWVSVLEVREQSLLCRTKSLEIVELFDWEVKPLNRKPVT
jgi:hypothetical protein